MIPPQCNSYSNIPVLEDMCQRLVFQTQSTSCMACKAFTWTIWCRFGIVYRHPCKRYPRGRLSLNAFMIIEEAPCCIITYQYVLLCISQNTMWTLTANTHNARDAWTRGLNGLDHLPRLPRWATQWVQELKCFETKHLIPTAVSLHFECMIKLAGIRGVLNN